MDWDHLRTFESVARLGSLTAAARALGVSQSTVSRQLKLLEERAGSPLLIRDTPVVLTPRGEQLLAAVEPMLEGALAAEAALDEQPALHGSVTIATVGELSRWVLVPASAVLVARHPGISLRILADNRVSSLAAGDADIAVRFVRPERGDLVSRKLRTERYALFVAETLALASDVPWLGLAGSLSEIAEQRYAERLFEGRAPALSFEDLESLGQAVREGLGVAVLPCTYARGLGLVEISPRSLGVDEGGPAPSRSVWMVVHASKARVPRVRAVMDWIGEAFADAAVAHMV